MMYCSAISVDDIELTVVERLYAEALDSTRRNPDPNLMRAGRTAAEPCMKSAS